MRAEASVDGFSAAVRFDGPASVVTVCGELDLATEARFERALQSTIRRGATEIRIDLTELEFMSASAIAVLLRCRRRARRRGIGMALSAGTGEPRRVLALAGVLECFDAHDG